MSLKSAKIALVSAFFLFAFLAVSVRAQVAPAALSGTIAGPAGAVPNVTVTATDSATNQSWKTQSDLAGRYTFANLAPGKYELPFLPRDSRRNPPR